MIGDSVTNDDEDLFYWKVKLFCEGIECQLKHNICCDKDRTYKQIIIEYEEKREQL